jgi:hypothetical protein
MTNFWSFCRRFCKYTQHALNTAILWFGTKLIAFRDWFSPLSDLRIICLLLLLCALTIIGLEPGLDVVRGMLDDANLSPISLHDFSVVGAARQWIAFLAACVWTGLNAWFWSNVLYKTQRGTQQPLWFTWFRRILGVSPLLCAMVAMLVVTRWSLADNWIAMSCFSAATVIMLLFFASKHRITKRIGGKLGASFHGRPRPLRPNAANGIHHGLLLGSFDRWFVGLTLAVSVLGLVTFSIPVLRTEAAWCLGSAAIAFGAVGCIIPITSLLIWATRDARIPVVAVGTICFCLFTTINDNHRVRTLPLAHQPAPTLDEALKRWQSRHPDQNDPIVLIATAGGASRAAYWTGAVLRSLDEKLDGGFSQSVFAISSVSGGTLGAIGYTAWLADNPPETQPAAMRVQRLKFMQQFLGADYLAPAIGGMLFPDLVQRFWPVPMFGDRAESLEESWEIAWHKAAQNCGPRCVSNDNRFSGDFEAIWSRSLASKDTGARWIPIVLANGTLANNGKRIITSPIRVTPDIFEDTYDFFDFSYGDGCGGRPCRIRASTAVTNSARFPIVSPAGRLGTGLFGSYGHIIDGGYFENGGLETLVDVLRFVRKHDPKRPIIVIEISNNDRAPLPDSLRAIGQMQPNVDPRKPGWFSPFLAGPRAIVGGLYNTSEARGISGAKRLSTRIGQDGLPGDPPLRYFRFKLVPIAADRYSTMSWSLSLSTRDAIDLLFERAIADPKLHKARLRDILGKRNHGDYPGTLQKALQGCANLFNEFQLLKIVHFLKPSEPDPKWKGRKQCRLEEQRRAAADEESPLR